MSGTGDRARFLFALAREDAPDASAREAMLRGVTVAAGAAASSRASSAGSASVPVATKLAILAAAAGAATAALVAILNPVLPEAPVVASSRPAHAVARTPRSSGDAALSPRSLAPACRADVRVRARDRSVDPTALASPRPPVNATVPGRARPAGDVASDLAEEARLITESRRALMAGDPVKALALVRAAKRAPTRALEPEELGLEARALRAAGEVDEAAATDLRLRRLYPEHALVH